MHSIEFMAGTMFFSVKFFCIMLTPKKKKEKKKGILCHRSMSGLFTKTFGGSKDFFSIYVVKRLANFSFKTANLVNIALKNRFFHNFVQKDC